MQLSLCKGNRAGFAVVLSLIAVLAGCRSSESKAMTRPLIRGSLLVTDGQIAAARERMQSDSELKQVFEKLQTSADRLLNDPPVERKLIGPRLLGVSKEAQRRIWLLAGMYRWKGEQKYADRAIVELRTVCSFSDWNPSHFLDVAEMCAAAAIGYDWLYEQLSPSDRELVRKAIVSKALLPAIEAYNKEIWWTKTDINWAQVCSGGLIMGALAIRDEEPSLAKRIFELTSAGMARPMGVYSPDGGYKEGAGYWNYGTRFSVLYFASLQSAIGYDSPLIKSEGFDKTGFFRIHTIGPSGKLFNYADCNEPVDSASHMFWLARQFNQPIFAQHEREYALKKPDILHLFWWNASVADLTKIRPNAQFSRAGVLCLRNTWDASAMFIGMKAGRSDFGHAHLDLGSFVLDWNGERWIIDLGSDDYNLPRYFGDLRWTYYRLRTEGHNTVQADNVEQSPQSVAAMDPNNSVRFVTNGATVDRKPAIDGGAIARIIDHIVAPGSHRIRWTLHTRAEVTISTDRKSAMLDQNGREMMITINGSGAFLAEPLLLPAEQKSAKGITRIRIETEVFDAADQTLTFRGIRSK